MSLGKLSPIKIESRTIKNCHKCASESKLALVVTSAHSLPFTSSHLHTSTKRTQIRIPTRRCLAAIARRRVVGLLDVSCSAAISRWEKISFSMSVIFVMHHRRSKKLSISRAQSRCAKKHAIVYVSSFAVYSYTAHFELNMIQKPKAIRKHSVYIRD